MLSSPISEKGIKSNPQVYCFKNIRTERFDFRTASLYHWRIGLILKKISRAFQLGLKLFTILEESYLLATSYISFATAFFLRGAFKIKMSILKIYSKNRQHDFITIKSGNTQLINRSKLNQRMAHFRIDVYSIPISIAICFVQSHL